MSAGFADDIEEDIETDVWAGIVPIEHRFGLPIPAPDGPVGRGEISVPESVLALYEGQE